MPLYEFKCQKEDCSLNGEIVTRFLKMNYSDEEAICDECQSILKRDWTGRATSVSSFSIMSIDQRQSALKKRSREHFKDDKYDRFHKRNAKRLDA